MCSATFIMSLVSLMAIVSKQTDETFATLSVMYSGDGGDWRLMTPRTPNGRSIFKECCGSLCLTDRKIFSLPDSDKSEEKNAEISPKVVKFPFAQNGGSLPPLPPCVDAPRLTTSKIGQYFRCIRSAWDGNHWKKQMPLALNFHP